MPNRIILPARPKHYATTSDDGSPRGQKLGDVPSASHGSRRPRVFSQALSTLKERDQPSDRGGAIKGNFKLHASLPSQLRSTHDSSKSPTRFDPADANTWGVGLPSSPHKGARFLSPYRNKAAARDQTWQNQDDHPSFLNSPTTSSPSEVADSDQFIKMIKDGLHLGPQRSEALDTIHATDRRDISSSYDSQHNLSTRIDSPASAVHVNKLSTSDLARFSHANDRLSNLRSSSHLSLEQINSTESDGHDVLQDASAAITQWRGETRYGSISFNKYALSDSSDESPPKPVTQAQRARGSSSDSLDKKIANAYRSDEINARTTFINGLGHQFDGVGELHRDSGRDDSPLPRPPAPADAMRYKQSKRKASTFSLRSLTKSLTKRPRLGFQRLAHTIRHESSRHLAQAKMRWRHQTAAEKSHFEAWRANRRRSRPADPLKGKSEKGFGIFSLERSRYGHEEWWRVGVERYQAPKWMVFQG